MIEFIKAGGWPMLVVLLFGTLALVASVRFVRRPEVETIGAVRALSLTTILAVIGGTAADLAAVFSYMAVNGGGDDTLVLLFTGLSEAMAPAILGFSLLAVVWFVAASGVQRLATA